MYIKGKYYRGLGVYLEVRTTYVLDSPPVKEYVFSTKMRDKNGAARLKRIKINI